MNQQMMGDAVIPKYGDVQMNAESRDEGSVRRGCKSALAAVKGAFLLSVLLSLICDVAFCGQKGGRKSDDGRQNFLNDYAQKKPKDGKKNKPRSKFVAGKSIMLADIRSGDVFDGIPKVVSSSIGKNNPPPYELLLPQSKYGTFVLHPNSTNRQNGNDKLFPPEMGHDLFVLYSQKTKYNWGFVMHTTTSYNPKEYTEKLWAMLGENLGTPEATEGSPIQDRFANSKGKIGEFIEAATKGDKNQIYSNGNFLAVIYTHPYKKYSECYDDASKKSRLWVIYIDLEMYGQACDELP